MMTNLLPRDLLPRVYRFLLFTYPREFRFAYGREMERLFHEQYRDAARRRNIAGFMMRTAADTVSTSLRERFDTARRLLSTARKSAPRGYVTEWIVTILLYLFATTTLVQAYVIPTGSMESTLRVGDHILVDRTAYANPGTCITNRSSVTVAPRLSPGRSTLTRESIRIVTTFRLSPVLSPARAVRTCSNTTSSTAR